MNDPFTTICIDGPLRGKTMAVDSMNFVVMKSSKAKLPSPLNADFDYPVTYQPEQVMYYVHRTIMFGHTVMVASTRPQQPRTEDAVRYLLSNAAKRAMLA